MRIDQATMDRDAQTALIAVNSTSTTDRHIVDTTAKVIAHGATCRIIKVDFVMTVEHRHFTYIDGVDVRTRTEKGPHKHYIYSYLITYKWKIEMIGITRRSGI